MTHHFEPSKAVSILHCKCPQCQSGQMFTHSAYHLGKFMQMHANCPVCKLQFEIEPGYFWGAMYVSYLMSVMMMLFLGGLILLLSSGEAGFWTCIIPIVGTLILGSPFTYRYARVFMLYFFSPVKFVKNLASQN